LVLPLAPLFLTAVVRLVGSRRSILTEIEFALVFVILTIVVIHVTGLSRSPLYPMLFLTASVLAIVLDIRVSVAAFLFLVISDAASIHLLEKSAGTGETVLVRIIVSSLFYIFFLLYGRIEFVKRAEIGRRLKRFEEDLRGLKGEAFVQKEGVSSESVEREAVRTLTNIDDTLFTLLDGAREALSVNGICYLVPDMEDGGFRVREGSSSAGELNFDSSVEGGRFGTAMQTGRPLTIRGEGGGGKLYPDYYKDPPSGVSVLAVVPVFDGGEVRGVLAFDGRLDDAVSEGRLPLFRLVAFMAGEIVGYKVHLSRFVVNLRELEELYAVSRKLAEAKKVGDVLDIVFAAAARMLPVKTMAFTSRRGDESVVIASWGKDSEKFRKIRFKNSDSLVGWVLENGKYLVYEGGDKKRDVFGQRYKIERGRAFMIFPLISEEELIGTFVLILRSEDLPYRFYIRIMEVIINMTAASMVGLRLMKRLNRFAITDPMTGLYNRRRFNRAIREHWERVERYSENLSLLIIDIDFFKKINDTYGHSTGDEVIKEVSATILRITRKVDIVSRIGGEEFAVLLPRISSESALSTAERIRRAVKKDTIKVGGNRISVTISVGISSYPGNWSSVEALMKGADDALYRAKGEGRDRCVVI